MSSRLSVSIIIMMLKSRMCQVTGPKTLRHRAVSLVCFIQDTIDQHLSAQLFSSCNCSKVESCNFTRCPFQIFASNVKLQSVLQQDSYHVHSCSIPSAPTSYNKLQQVTETRLVTCWTSLVTSDDFSHVFLYVSSLHSVKHRVSTESLSNSVYLVCIF